MLARFFYLFEKNLKFRLEIKVLPYFIVFLNKAKLLFRSHRTPVISCKWPYG